MTLRETLLCQPRLERWRPEYVIVKASPLAQAWVTVITPALTDRTGLHEVPIESHAVLPLANAVQPAGTEPSVTIDPAANAEPTADVNVKVSVLPVELAVTEVGLTAIVPEPFAAVFKTVVTTEFRGDWSTQVRPRCASRAVAGARGVGLICIGRSERRPGRFGDRDRDLISRIVRWTGEVTGDSAAHRYARGRATAPSRLSATCRAYREPIWHDINNSNIALTAVPGRRNHIVVGRAGRRCRRPGFDRCDRGDRIRPNHGPTTGRAGRLDLDRRRITEGARQVEAPVAGLVDRAGGIGGFAEPVDDHRRSWRWSRWRAAARPQPRPRPRRPTYR